MNAKELLNKYIQYDSKITFDIFKLIYQKLIDLGFTSPHTVENAFKEFSGRFKYFTLKLYDGEKYFNQFDSLNADKSEISVEDILGYNPFESFKLPEKWYVKVTGDSINYPELAKWRGSWCYSGISYVKSDTYWTAKFPEDFIEITLEQFKEFIMNEPVKTETIETEKDWSKATEEEILAEAKRKYPVGTKYRGVCSNLIEGVVNADYDVRKPFKNDEIVLDAGKDYLFYKNRWAEIISLPETKVKEDASKSIEEWSVGSYAVALKDKINWSMTQKGDIYEITNIGIATNLTKSCPGLSFSTPKLDTEFKWFATKHEAEEFAKTLVEPVKCGNGILDAIEKPSKQPLKQVVHCKTQEEWDFVLSKLPSTCLLSAQSDGFKEYIEENPSGIAVNTVNCEWSDLEWWKEEGYQVISFQEWCDLNGYKMEKSKQEILKEFAEKYPPGTKVKSPDGIEFIISTTHKHKGENNDFLQSSPYYTGLCGDVLAVKENSCMGEYLYKDGKYAEIIKDAPKFEVGKWYRITDGKSKCIGKDIWYAKSIVVRDNIITAGEYWHNYLDTNGNFGNVGDYTFTEVPLSEIQWFLPDGHPDKIIKEAQKVIKTETYRVRVTSSEIKVLKI